jgi:hypothetical protein
LAFSADSRVPDQAGGEGSQNYKQRQHVFDHRYAPSSFANVSKIYVMQSKDAAFPI